MPGWTLPGVMTTGALQTLVRAQRVCPGERVLIAGNGPLNLQLACELLACGVKPVAVVEAAPRPGPAAWRDAWQHGARRARSGARRAVACWRTLRRAGVPVLWSTRVTGAATARTACSRAHCRSHGDRTLGCRYRRAEPRLPAGDRVWPARSACRIASSMSGWAIWRPRPMRTAAPRSPSVFAVGDGAALGGARVAMARGRLAGLAAARDLGFACAGRSGRTRARWRDALAFQDALWRVFRPPRCAPELLPTQPSSAAARRSPPAGCALNWPAG